MTAPVRDPRYWAEAVDQVVEAGMEPVRLPGGLVGAKFPVTHWAATFTPEQRGDIRRACVEVRRLATHEHLDPLWRAATETLHELNDYCDRKGETS